MRRSFLKQAAGVAACVAVSPLAMGQNDWPSRVIKILVPYPPGGALDPVARALGQRLSTLLGQPVIVENRPGGGTSIAAGAIVRGEADGYTLLFGGPITHVVHSLLAPRGYDSVKDFTGIAAVSRGDYSLVVHPSVPANTLPEFIAYGKANPDKINASLASIGGADNLATELFKQQTGIRLTGVAYKGSAAALNDLMAGRTQMFIVAHSLAETHVESGKLRFLAYAAAPVDKPNAPTFAQAGLKDFEQFVTMNIVLAHAATPAPIVSKLTGAIKSALESPETRTAILASKQVPYYMPPGELNAKLAADQVKFANLIQKIGLKVN